MSSKKVSISRPRRGCLSRLWNDESGASILIIGLSFLALAGFVGLAVEVGYWYFERRAMQSAVDEAALSGAYVMFKNQSLSSSQNSDITAASKNDAKRNGYDDAAANITVTVNHPYAGDDSKVEVIMSKTEAGTFSKLFGAGGTSIVRRAVAQCGSKGHYCMLALDESCPETVKINGSNIANLAGCPIQSNSIDPNSALLGTGTAVVTTPSISAAGALSIGNNFTLNGGTFANFQPTPDPLSQLPAYSPGGCSSIANVNCGGANSGNAGCTAANPLILNPGCYNNMNFQNNRFFQLSAGDYYTPGNFSVGPSTVKSATGAGVTIHLGPNGTADVQSTATVDLRAPTSGTYKDILFFQSRSAPNDSCGPQYSNSFNGGSTQHLEGTLYFRNQGVSVNGNATVAGTPQCMRIVSRFLRMNGTANIDVNCNGAGGGGGTDYLPPTLIQ